MFHGPENQAGLPRLLEGYLYAVGEICHGVFGREGEEAMYRGVGAFFLRHLLAKGELAFTGDDPWSRYCDIVRLFTEKGFYTYVELTRLDDGRYWMLEQNQYAGSVWEEQNSWERGSAPCPLWCVILAGLAEIDQTIILDDVGFREEAKGFESTFHFEKLEVPPTDIIELTRRRLIPTLLPMCAHCGRIRDEHDRWQDVVQYMQIRSYMHVSHGLCPDCVSELRPEDAEEVIRRLAERCAKETIYE